MAYPPPGKKGGGLFIAFFTATDPRLMGVFFYLRPTAPWRQTRREFPESIRGTSPDFCEIYNEALAAEHYRLMQICGVGYRKSLEFLIKDYVTAKHPNDADKIKNTLLGVCIEAYVSDRN